MITGGYFWCSHEKTKRSEKLLMLWVKISFLICKYGLKNIIQFYWLIFRMFISFKLAVLIDQMNIPI